MDQHPELLMKTFTKYCWYISILNGFILESFEEYGNKTEYIDSQIHFIFVYLGTNK